MPCLKVNVSVAQSSLSTSDSRLYPYDDAVPHSIIDDGKPLPVDVSGCPYAVKPKLAVPGTTETTPAAATALSVQPSVSPVSGPYDPPSKATASVVASPCPKSDMSEPS